MVLAGRTQISRELAIGPKLKFARKRRREVGGVGACTCIVPTLGDPRETCLAGIDRIKTWRGPPAASWRRRLAAKI